MQRHHGPLTETDQRQRRWRQLPAREFGVKETIERGRRLVDAGPALARIAERQCKPFAPDRRLAVTVRRVRRHEGGVRQQASPSAADLDQVVAVGAIAVQEHYQLPRLARARLDSWSIKFWAVEFSHFCVSFSSLVAFSLAAEPGPRRVSSPRDNRPRADAPPRRARAARPRRFLQAAWRPAACEA